MEKEKEMSEFFIDVLENGIAVSKLTEVTKIVTVIRAFATTVIAMTAM